MKKSKHIAQTCLVIVKNLSPSGDYIELGICRNYTDSMIYELTNKVPELHIPVSYTHLTLPTNREV